MPKVIHFEIPTSDLNKAADFYSKTFSWDIQSWGNENYLLATTGDKSEPGINGAIYLKDWMTEVVNTINVPDLEEAIGKIKANGGEVVRDIMEIPNIGRNAYFKDPDGNLIGVMQSFPDSIMPK